MTTPGQTTLGALRASVRFRADMVNSQFCTDPEIDTYINGSAAELYDLLCLKFGNDYSVATQYTLTTDGTNDHYTLPDGSGAAPAFYKLLGVDLQISAGPPAKWTTLKPFGFSERNRGSYPGTYYNSYANLRYRLAGNQLWLAPMPTSGLTIGVWYVPRFVPLAADTDILDGVSGWEELVIVDAAIKCLQKEESDVSILMAQKQGLLRRIDEAAENRDAGSPAMVGGVRRDSDGWDGY